MYVLDVNQPVGGVVESGGSRGLQLIVALVSPEPPSLKLTWRSYSGEFVNVTTPVPVGRFVVQLVPLTATADKFT